MKLKRSLSDAFRYEAIGCDNAMAFDACASKLIRCVNVELAFIWSEVDIAYEIRSNCPVTSTTFAPPQFYTFEKCNISCESIKVSHYTLLYNIFSEYETNGGNEVGVYGNSVRQITMHSNTQTGIRFVRWIGVVTGIYCVLERLSGMEEGVTWSRAEKGMNVSSNGAAWIGSGEGKKWRDADAIETHAECFNRRSVSLKCALYITL
ncbi:hypothetical protein V1478_011996 [Vespula squamosa]|uniref:Uncharacterized protein n=1 Tax=Vespula squamosa TaxID=30214 RepID=A0ABD2AE67_VESSQ